MFEYAGPRLQTFSVNRLQKPKPGRKLLKGKRLNTGYQTGGKLK